MALKGPVPTASVIGGTSADVQPPAFLTPAQRKIFADLVAKAKAAKLNLAQFDDTAFAVLACYVEEYRKNPNVRTGRDLIALLREFGATPMARARLGAKPETGGKSKMAQLLKLPPKTA